MTVGVGTPFWGVFRNSTTTLVAVAVIVLLSWWYLIDMATDVGSVALDERMAFRVWTPSYFILMLGMWVIMMVAMMLPGATPMILLYRQVARKNRLPRAALGTTLFVSGYLVVWVLFSVVATILQWLLSQWAILGPMMQSRSLVFSGATLIGAGLYQWSPWKNACLRHCRGPLFFITVHWRPGLSGALYMGLIHGAYCVGCCSLLMALLFVGGVMNLLVIALIALIVLLEKALPGGERFARIMGAITIISGSALLVWA